MYSGEWTIEQWARFEQSFDESQKNPKKIIFDERQKYETISLLCEDPKLPSLPLLALNLSTKPKVVKSKVKINHIRLKRNTKKNKKISNIQRGGILEKWQYEYLGEEFKKCKSPNNDKARQIAETLGITIPKVINWFKNNRAKENRRKAFDNDE